MDTTNKIEKLTKKQIEEVKGGLLSQYRSLQQENTKTGGEQNKAL
ncbi:hypothetical protein QE385_003896 [Sphingomonas sp. SORGH_AS 950]|nr:hypothetical protein [Sphingomonas sp. SORGH_AS_0950]MDQ1159499.1 hypothetical protein [Sphingomonas sp. SORGH_AS_0950]